MARLGYLALLACAALIFAACGGAPASPGSGGTTSSAPSTATPEVETDDAGETDGGDDDETDDAGENVLVNIVDFGFEPGEITVATGTTIFWANTGEAPHTATADDGSFDTGRLASGEREGVTFETAGEFPYFCSIHPDMRGTVTVEE